MRDEHAAEKHFGAQDGHGSDWDAPDDADDLDDPLEFEAWRVRELVRATRERDEREKATFNEAETVRRRHFFPASFCIYSIERRRATKEDERSCESEARARARWAFYSFVEMGRPTHSSRYVFSSVSM